METNNGPAPAPNYKCSACSKTLDNLKDLRTHQKTEHPICKRFLEGTCQRSIFFCWYKHELKETSSEVPQEGFSDSDFQFPPLNPFPPEQTQIIMNTLNMILQKMKEMEERFLQKEQ